MPSPTCQVKDGAGAYVSTANGVDVADDGAVVTIKLEDVFGVDVWSPSIVGSDDAVAVPSLTVDNVAKTATFTKPAGPWSLIVQSKVNGGVDVNGQKQDSYTTTFKISIPFAGARLMASNERAEGSTSFGWTTIVNALARLAYAGGGITSALINDASFAVPNGGIQLSEIENLTANRTGTLPTAPTKNMQAWFRANDTTIGTFKVTLDGGTKHIWVGATDMGTTYDLTAATLGAGGTAKFIYDGTAWRDI